MPKEKNHKKTLFLTAIEIESVDERRRFLDQACGDDQELRGQILQLLDAHENPPHLVDRLDQAAATCVMDTELTGQQIGPYKLLEVIGEGGMGTVYMARQTEPVKRRVALKLIKTGMDTRRVIARFEAERQALAMMDHPNIAKVLDAGATESGRPYFVMELVKGKPITEFCDGQRLDTESRLKLFQKVCQAVQHAHQKGIIHRDLKPSNVMVAMYDDQPVPKVIDFGVAKATGDELTEQTMFTRFGQIVGTLEYMSPEQAQFNNRDIDTRTDIYSLGAILYELLAGEPPFEREKIKSQALDETLRMIREDEPTKPSTTLKAVQKAIQTASDRQTKPEKLGLQLRGDLDWIVMMTLDKDRSKRYQTATGLAADIERYLDHQPVLATPPTAAYALRKFIVRNKVGVAFASLTGLFLVFGMVGLIVGVVLLSGKEQAIRSALKTAEENLSLAEKNLILANTNKKKAEDALENAQLESLRLENLANFIISGLIRSATPDGKGDSNVTVMDALLSLEGKLDDSFPNHPKLQGWILGQLGQYYYELGRWEDSRRVLTAARKQLVEARVNRDLVALNVEKNLAWTLTHLGQHDEAIELAQHVVNLAPEVFGNEAGVEEAWNLLGVALYRAGRFDESEQAFQTSIRLAEQFGDTGKAAIGNLGDIYYAKNDFQRAEECYEKAYQLRLNEDGENHIETMRVLDDLAITYARQKRPAKAREILAKLLETKRRLGVNTQSILDTLDNLARLEYENSNYDVALEWMEQAVQTAADQFGPSSPPTLVKQNNLVLILRDLGRWDAAIATCEQVVSVREKIRDSNPDDTENVSSLATVYFQLGLIQGFKQDHLAAVDEYDKAVAFFEELTERKNPGLNTRQYFCDTLRWRSTSLRRLGRFSESIEDAERARELTEALDEKLDCDLRRAQAIAEMGKHEQAVETAEKVLGEVDNEGYLTARAASIYAIGLRDLAEDHGLIQHYRNRSMELLQLAADLGWFDSPIEAILLEQNPDFEALRNTEEFKFWLEKNIQERTEIQN